MGGLTAQARQVLEGVFDYGLGYNENDGGCGYMALFGYQNFLKLGIEPEVVIAACDTSWVNDYIDRGSNRLKLPLDVAYTQLEPGDWSLYHVLLRVEVEGEKLFFDTTGFHKRVSSFELTTVPVELLEILVRCKGWNTNYKPDQYNDEIKAIFDRTFAEAKEVQYVVPS